MRQTQHNEFSDRLKFSKEAVRRSIKLANFCGRGLVAEENRPMKSLNHDTRHLTKTGRRWGRRRFYVALFFDWETT